MTTRNVTVKDALACHPLAPAVLRQLGGGKDAVSSAIDAAKHGAGGGFHGFISYSDTVYFFNQNRAAIITMAESMADDLGEEMLAMVAGFECLKELKLSAWTIAKAIAPCSKCEEGCGENSDLIKNAMAWFALEEVGRAIVNLSEQPSRRCASCGAQLGADWDRATVHVDRKKGITCGGKIH